MVITDKQTIKLEIGMEPGCCEVTGYFWCNENPSDFNGSSLLGVSITDKELNTAIFNRESGGFSEGGVMFVNLETDKGLLQFVAYNWHNGYYGHTAKVSSKQLTFEENL